MSALATTRDLAIDIHPGEHKIIWHLGGMTLHGDTIISTLIAGALLILLGLMVRRSVSVRNPGKLQLFYEAVTQEVERQVEESLGIKTAPFVVPLALCLFLFILFANWLALIPTKEYIPPPASDPAKVQFRLPTAIGRMARSAAELSMQARPSRRIMLNASQRDRA